MKRALDAGVAGRGNAQGVQNRDGATAKDTALMKSAINSSKSARGQEIGVRQATYRAACLRNEPGAIGAGFSICQIHHFAITRFSPHFRVNLIGIDIVAAANRRHHESHGRGVALV